MGICNPACTEEQIRCYPVNCKRVKSMRKGGFYRFGLLDCDVEIDDITDVTEWEAVIAAGKWTISPEGLGALPKPESSKEIIVAGVPEETVDEVSSFTFMTKLFDNDNYLDFDFQYDVKEQAAYKTLVLFGCDGLLYYDRLWVAGANPGIGGLSVEVWRESENQSSQALHIDFTFNTFNSGFKAFPLTKELLDALNVACEVES